jgi:hypothetical protein
LWDTRGERRFGGENRGEKTMAKVLEVPETHENGDRVTELRYGKKQET